MEANEAKDTGFFGFPQELADRMVAIYGPVEKIEDAERYADLMRDAELRIVIDHIPDKGYVVLTDDPEGGIFKMEPKVEKALARGQRISRQPWKAWNRHGRYLGVFATKREAQAASQSDVRPAPTDSNMNHSAQGAS